MARNPGPTLGQAHYCGWFKLVNRIKAPIR